MKRTLRSPGLDHLADSVDLILFAWHMQKTARTAAARRLFGQFLQVELEQHMGTPTGFRRKEPHDGDR